VNLLKYLRQTKKLERLRKENERKKPRRSLFRIRKTLREEHLFMVCQRAALTMIKMLFLKKRTK
jgi:hypothetical protein